MVVIDGLLCCAEEYEKLSVDRIALYTTYSGFLQKKSKEGTWIYHVGIWMFADSDYHSHR